EVDRVIGIGGAQAGGALAYGTRSVPRVDKIVGPGNVYVAEAKRQVFGQVGIDMVAGPSEILVIADGRTPADWLAMDLFSQAEHDEAAQALLLSPQSSYLDQVELSMKKLLPAMPRREIITASLAARGALIETRDLEEACALANRIAPEHLELSVEDPQAWLPKLKHAGAIFLGRWSSEAIGDYCAGPNHVLPTAGSARFSSPLGVYDFQKRSSVIGVSQAAAARLGKLAAVRAEGEGRTAHARSAARSFVMYGMNAALCGMKAVAVPLREDFSFDAGAFLVRMKSERPELVFIAYPNNPTGVLYPEEDVLRVIRAAEGLVVLDEAYHVFAGRTFMQRLGEQPNLVVL